MRQGDRAANVWETTDGGTTWHNVSSDIPNAPVWHVLYDQPNHVISGEQSDTKVVFEQNDLIFVSKGTSQGVKNGDEFLVVRPVEDPTKYEWTKWQNAILHKMGTVWEDEGRVARRRGRRSGRLPALAGHRPRSGRARWRSG